MSSATVLALGLLAGLLSGLFGIGGGLIIVPALSVLLGLEFHEAAGTSLAALLLPVGGLGAYAYWRQGHVNLPYAGLLALGLFVGAFLGAMLSRHIQTQALERSFGVLLIAVGARFVFWGA